MSEYPKPVLNSAAVAVGLVASTMLIAAGLEFKDRGNTIDHLQYESKAKTESLAAAQAASFTAALYDRVQYPKGVLMPVLNGEIRTTIKSAGITHKGVYKDPILLATDDIDAKPDVAGNFLKGAWIGVQGNDANGKAVISAVRYNPDDEKFVPYTHKPTDIIFPHLGVYATAVKGAPGLDIDGLVGFDVLGETAMQNGDGSAITPGLSMGMK